MEVHMPRLGRPKKPLVLTDDEREILERWARRPKSPQSLALRSKIVLACAEGPTNREVAARLGVAEATVVHLGLLHPGAQGPDADAELAGDPGDHAVVLRIVPPHVEDHTH